MCAGCPFAFGAYWNVSIIRSKLLQADARLGTKVLALQIEATVRYIKEVRTAIYAG